MKTKPRLLIASPMFRAFNCLQALSKDRRDPEKVKRDFVEASVHLEFCIEMYGEQVKSGRYFLHENPSTATSWKNHKMQELSKMPGVMRLIERMCRHGMEAEDKQGKA